jgi:hypothetical protein
MSASTPPKAILTVWLCTASIPMRRAQRNEFINRASKVSRPSVRATRERTAFTHHEHAAIGSLRASPRISYRLRPGRAVSRPRRTMRARLAPVRTLAVSSSLPVGPFHSRISNIFARRLVSDAMAQTRANDASAGLALIRMVGMADAMRNGSAPQIQESNSC